MERDGRRLQRPKHGKKILHSVTASLVLIEGSDEEVFLVVAYLFDFSAFSAGNTAWNV